MKLKTKDVESHEIKKEEDVQSYETKRRRHWVL